MAKATSTNRKNEVGLPLTAGVSPKGRAIKAAACCCFSIVFMASVVALIAVLKGDMSWAMGAFIFPCGVFGAFRALDNINELVRYRVLVTQEGIGFGGAFADNFVAWDDIQSIQLNEGAFLTHFARVKIQKKLGKQSGTAIRRFLRHFQRTFYIPAQLDMPGERFVQLLQSRLRDVQRQSRANRLAKKAVASTRRKPASKSKQRKSGTR